MRGAEHERLGQSVGRGLDRVVDGHAEPAAVAQQAPELRAVLGRGDHQDVPDPGEQQRGQRVVDHGLVVDGHQLLADALRDRVQAASRAAGQNDAPHVFFPPFLWNSLM